MDTYSKNCGIRISAVICTYRRIDTLASAIESLINQSLPSNEYEIIVVDNNSGDDTPEIVRRYVKDTSFSVKYVLELEQGLSHARNTSIKHAEGEIIAFLDDDAEADPGWLRALIEIYDNIPDAWAVGGKVLPIWDAERPKWLKDTMLRSLSIVEWGDEKRPLKWPERIIGANCSFRKPVFSEIGLFSTNLGRIGKILLGNEDTEIQERIHKMSKFVFYTPQAIVHHHVPRERMTKKYFYERSYGAGRSQALLIALQGDHDAILKQALLILRGLPKQAVSIIGKIRQEDSRFQYLQGQFYKFGFIRQATGSLLFNRSSSDKKVIP